MVKERAFRLSWLRPLIFRATSSTRLLQRVRLVQTQLHGSLETRRGFVAWLTSGCSSWPLAAQNGTPGRWRTNRDPSGQPRTRSLGRPCSGCFPAEPYPRSTAGKHNLSGPSREERHYILWFRHLGYTTCSGISHFVAWASKRSRNGTAATAAVARLRVRRSSRFERWRTAATAAAARLAIRGTAAFDADVAIRRHDAAGRAFATMAGCWLLG